MEEIEFQDFLKIQMHVGTILSASVNKKARNPAYVLDVDFGSLIGVKKTSAQITENYSLGKLVGMQVVAIINFPPKRVAGIKSEVLVLAAVCKSTGTTLLSLTDQVENGTRIL